MWKNTAGDHWELRNRVWDSGLKYKISNLVAKRNGAIGTIILILWVQWNAFIAYVDHKPHTFRCQYPFQVKRLWVNTKYFHKLIFSVYHYLYSNCKDKISWTVYRIVEKSLFVGTWFLCLKPLVSFQTLPNCVLRQGVFGWCTRQLFEHALFKIGYSLRSNFKLVK